VPIRSTRSNSVWCVSTFWTRSIVVCCSVRERMPRRMCSRRSVIVVARRDAADQADQQREREDRGEHGDGVTPVLGREAGDRAAGERREHARRDGSRASSATTGAPE
jgi:hypothetical protein